MKQRGRRGENVIPLPGCDGHLSERPEPPRELSKPEAEIWRAVVSAKPGDWFGPENFALLADYCTACVESQGAWRAYKRAKGDRGAQLRQIDMWVRLKISLATKMRLTQQAKYRADKVVAISQSPPPWST